MRGIIEYVTVTANTGEYLDCVGNLTQRTYRDVEWLESEHFDSPPEIGKIGILMEIQNNEFVFIGRLKQYKSSEIPGELRIFAGKDTGIVIKEAGEGHTFEIYKATVSGGGANQEYVYTPTTSIKIDENGEVQIESSGNVQVTGAEIQLNGSSKGVAREGDSVTVSGSTGVGGGGTSEHSHAVNITAQITTSSSTVKTD